MAFEALQHTFKWKKNFGMLKSGESSKDFMFAVKALIKPLDHQKKKNWCFALTFTEADSEPSQTSKIELLQKYLNALSR